MSESKRVIRLEEFDEEEFFDDAEHQSEFVRKPKKRAGLFSFRNLIIFLLLIATGGVFLPQIAAWTPLGDIALGYLVPADKGTLRIQHRDLAWWKPVIAKQIQLDGPNGKPLASISEIRTQQTLWQIASTGSVKDVLVKDSVVAVELREGGSNWEDFLARLAPETPPQESKTTLQPLKIRIENAEVSIKGDLAKRAWLLTDLQATIQVGKDAGGVFVDWKNKVIDSLGTVKAGDLSGKVAYATPENVAEAFSLVHRHENYKTWSKPASGVAFSIQAQQLPMGLVQAVASRVDSQLKIGGIAYGNLAGSASLGDPEVGVDLGQWSVLNFSFSNPNWIGADVVRQQRVDLSGNVAAKGDQILLRDTRLKADIGNIVANGRLRFSDLSRAVSQQRLPAGDIGSTANIDLAGLSKQLPNTLKLRNGIDVRSGVLKWEVFNQRQTDGSTRLFADLSASGLQGMNQGSSFRWVNPVRISGAIRDYSRPVELEFLKAESDFLNAKLDPTSSGGLKGNLDVDFNRMRQALSQVFELPPIRMAGTGSGTVKLDEVRPGDKRLLAAGLNLDLTNVDLSFPGIFEIRDPKVKLDFNTQIQPKNFTTQDQSKHLWRFLQEPSNLVLTAGSVKLTTQPVGQRNVRPGVIDPNSLDFFAQLKKPVDLADFLGDQIKTGSDRFLASCRASGAIDRWLQVVRPLLGGIDLAATGNASVKGDVELSSTDLKVSGLDLQGKNVRFRGFGLLLDEPDVIATGSASVNFQSGAIQLPDTVLACSTLAVRAVKFEGNYLDVERIKGDVFLRSNVARLWDVVGKLQSSSQPINRNNFLGQLYQQVPNPLFLHPGPLAVSLLPPQGQAVDRIAARPPSVRSSSSPMLMGGELLGMVRFTPSPAGENQVTLQSTVSDFWIGGYQVGGKLVAYVKEPKIEVNSQTTLGKGLRSVAVKSFNIKANRGTANVTGIVKDLLTAPLIDLKGGLNADLISVVKPLGGAMTSDLAVNGLQNHQFQLSGPLDTSKMTGTWSTDFQKIHWMGLSGGAAKVNLQLSGGVVRTQPIEMPIGGGTVRIAPEVDMTGESTWIRHPRGVICQDVKLTPEICRHWLKYAAPLLAEVTSVQGSFSLDSDGVEVPLEDWTKMVAKARVTINGARVGPGPLGIKITQLIRSVKSLSSIKNLDQATLGQLGTSLGSSSQGGDLLSGLLGAGQGNGQGAAQPTNTLASSWVDIPTQTIPLEYSKGAFRHKDLKMSVDGYVLTSQGAVGLDQTIDASTQLTAPQEIIQKNQQIASLLNGSLRIPISGTLSKPKVDVNSVKTALLGAAQREVRRSATDRIGKELQKRIGDKKLLDLGKGLLGGQDGGKSPGDSLKKEANRLLEKNLNKGLKKLFGNQ